jgi:protein tyrosine phosphatase (PTP) superfamily phosphohydrolase (DUF442 family)
MSDKKVEEIPNYLCISETIGTAGQPTAEQFGDIKAAAYEVVVNLAMPDSLNALPNESELVAEQGMAYVHIPVVWECPTAKDLEQFFAVMDEHRDRKVLVHCVVNKRVSSFIFLYRVIRQGIPSEDARGALLRIWEPNAVWQSFMDDSLIRHDVNAYSRSSPHPQIDVS